MGRPIWKGSISFGLVNIPIQLETAVREQTVSFNMLSKDGSCRLRRPIGWFARQDSLSADRRRGSSPVPV